MKKTVLLLLCLFLLTQLSAQPFKNLNFEAGNKEIAASWKLGEGTTAKRSQENKNWILHLFGSYHEDKPGYIYQQYQVSPREFTRYKITASVKTGTPDSTAAFDLYSYTKEGERWLQYKFHKESFSEAKDWQDYSTEIWLSPNADSFRIGISLSGKGEIWVDNVQVESQFPGNCPLPDSIQAFMAESLDLVSERSLFKDNFTREDLLKQWTALSSCSPNTEVAAEGLSLLLQSIDHHSFYLPAANVRAWANTSSSETSKQMQITYSKGHLLDDDYAYIWMPWFVSSDSLSQTKFADQLHNLIDSLDHPGIKGWVLDLRENGGGNCWPMLAGIGPLLGEGICGYFKKETEMVPWIYKDGKGIEKEKVYTSTSRKAYVPHTPNPKVAVLFSKKTGSSGEIVALAFTGKSQYRSFGSQSGGYCTGNENYELINGGMLFLTESVFADRHGKAFPDFLLPDVEVLDDPETEEDEVVEAALGWLREKRKAE